MGRLILRSGVYTTPNAFTFVDQSNVALSSTITSAAITISGINTPVTISVTGGSYDINSSGSFTSSSGTVNNGDTVRARVTSSGSNSTAVNAVVTIGGVSDTFTATTASSGLTDLSQIYRLVDYDGRTNGATPSDTGFSYYDTPVIDGTELFDGTHKSVKHTMANLGNGPYGQECDYTGFTSNPNFAEGDELWYAIPLKVDATFDFSAAGNLKWLRLANIRVDGATNVGWIDFYITSDTDGAMKAQNEFAVGGGFAEQFDSQADSALRATNYKFPKNTWVVFQGYVKFHHTPGQGIVRAWADNTPIYEDLTHKTMVNSTDKVFYTYWQSYWNGSGIPAGNVGKHMFASRNAIAIKTAVRDDTSLLATDSRGNKFIKML